MDFTNVEYVKNYDGDTVTVNIQNIHPLLGHNIPIRIRDIDTEEMKTHSKNAKDAKLFVQTVLSNAKSINLINVERGKYFRLIADIYVDGVSLGEMLVNRGLAIRKEYR